MSEKDKRTIPDGAYHSGLMKDYGGMYNPDYVDPQDAELIRLRKRDAVLVEALEAVERDVRSPADYCDDRSARAVFQFIQQTIRDALDTVSDTAYKDGWEMDRTFCGTNSCDAVATHRVFWPGREPLPLCEPCKERALGISQAMGFYLHVEDLETPSAPAEKPSDR